jgi:hypothetical protein
MDVNNDYRVGLSQISYLVDQPDLPKPPEKHDLPVLGEAIVRHTPQLFARDAASAVLDDAISAVLTDLELWHARDFRTLSQDVHSWLTVLSQNKPEIDSGLEEAAAVVEEIFALDLELMIRRNLMVSA